MNNTLQNGFRLLELLAASGKDASVSEIAGETGLSTSNVCRLLKTLTQTGYVEQSPDTRRYRVSLKILNLSHARLASLDFRRIGHPFAAKLARALRAHTYLSQPLRGRSLIVDVAYPGDAQFDAGIVVGQIHSIRHSACGKICAAFAGEEERVELYRDIARDEPEVKRAAWLAECGSIRRERFAVREEPGVLALAAPLFRAGGVFCGALGVLMPQGATLTPAVRREVCGTAEAISFALGQPFAE